MASCLPACPPPALPLLCLFPRPGLAQPTQKDTYPPILPSTATTTTTTIDDGLGPGPPVAMTKQ